MKTAGISWMTPELWVVRQHIADAVFPDAITRLERGSSLK